MERTRSLLALAALLTGCVGTPYEAPPAQSREVAAAAKPEFVRVTAGARDVDAVVREAQATAKGEQRRLLVYVGATWCEPCQRFQDAVEQGKLDAELAGIRFLEFDADVDGGKLGDAGYGGELIPRFSVPGNDGRGGTLKIEGGVKGEAAVEHIMRRLGELLARSA